MDRRQFVSKSILAAGGCMAGGFQFPDDNEDEVLQILKAHASQPPWSSDAAHEALKPFGARCILGIRTALRAAEFDLCYLAISVVKRMKDDALPVLPELIFLARGIRPSITVAAWKAIGGLGEAARVAERDLERCRKTSPESIRHVVADTLLRINPSRIEELSGDFSVALADPGRALPTTWLIGELGDLGWHFLPQLESLSTQADDCLRCKAAVAIYKITKDMTLESVRTGVELATELLQSRWEEERKCAVFDLLAFGEAARSALPQLAAAKSDSNKTVRTVASKAIQQFSNGAAIRAISYSTEQPINGERECF